jgi:hypothetical protein
MDWRQRQVPAWASDLFLRTVPVGEQPVERSRAYRCQDHITAINGIKDGGYPGDAGVLASQSQEAADPGDFG